MYKLLDGKKLQAKIIQRIKSDVEDLKTKGIFPSLVVVQVGDDMASNIYIRNKLKKANEVGISAELIKLDNSISQKELENKIIELNTDKKTHAILVQFPLPKHINKDEIVELIDPLKDADGIHAQNVKNIIGSGLPIACTAKGIMSFFADYNIPLNNKKTVVIGKSKIVGAPTAYLLKNEGANVFSADSLTSRELLKQKIQEADIVVSATGVKDVIDANWLKKGVTLVDVGIIRSNKKLRGDIDFEVASQKAEFITPVPGGVGPMTITMLLDNVALLAKNKEK